MSSGFVYVSSSVTHVERFPVFLFPVNVVFKVASGGRVSQESRATPGSMVMYTCLPENCVESVQIAVDEFSTFIRDAINLSVHCKHKN